MSVMTAQPPLPIAYEAPATLLGQAAALVEDETGGRVFLHGILVYSWAPGEDAVRRWSAVQLTRLKVAPVGEIAAGFGVDPTTVWRWGQTLTGQGLAGLASDKRGPKGPTRLTAAVITRIHALAAGGATRAAIARTVGVSTTTVRRALAMPDPKTATGTDADTATAGTADAPAADNIDTAAADAAGGADADAAAAAADTAGAGGTDGWQRGGPGEHAKQVVPVLPVLPGPVDRAAERVLARFGLIEHASPVFAPAARVPLAGLLLALPALQATGLLGCARRVFGALPNGFYGLDTVLLEAVWRTLAGEARAEGATRIDPVAFGRMLGLDRAPEVKTIRRRLGLLAGTGNADQLIAAMAATHLARTDPPTSQGEGGQGEDGDAAAHVGVVLYVDGHVRAYQGTRKIGKTHLARLRFPAPATLETWVSDAHGDPVLVVMAEPGASLAGELRRLVPELRAAVGDERRVLVGFDRGGWSPALFKHLHGHGFDVLTWRKGPSQDVDPDEFSDITYQDEQTGRKHTWRAADTTITLPLSTRSTAKTRPDRPEHANDDENGEQHDDEQPDGENDDEQPEQPDDEQPDSENDEGQPDDGSVFTMRQVTLAVPARAGTHSDGAAPGVRQIHILTTRTDLPTAQVIHRMGSRWRQENYFRYARMHFALDAHDSYAATEDDPARPVPNPAKKRAYQQVQAARARHEQAAAHTDAALLAARSPKPGGPVLITNTEHDAITAPLWQAAADLHAAQAAHQATPTRVPLGQLNPGQQVLDTQTKLLTHAIRMAAFNTATTLARELRLHTGYARKNDEAHVLIRQALTWTGDIDPTTPGILTIRLDPLPTTRASTAIAELCQHLTATQTRYPGTDLRLRYEMKTAP